MAQNQYVNKVVFGNSTVLDITNCTVEPSKLAQGYTALDKSGQLITGTMEIPTLALTVVNMPTKTAYLPNEQLDLSGLEVALVSNDGYSLTVTNGCTYVPANGTILTTDDTTVSISYRYNGILYNTSFNISVFDIVSWASGTDAQISSMLNSHYNGDIDIHDYWSIGDKRIVTLFANTASEENVEFVLSENGGKTLSDGVTECAYQVDQVNCLKNTMRMAGGYPDWDGCERREWCNSTYKDAFPVTLVSIFKEFINPTGGKTAAGKKPTFIKESIDTFALRSTIEVFGETQGAYAGEGTHVEWYKTASNRIKQVNGKASGWWERSPAQYSFYAVSVSGTKGNIDRSYKLGGIAPFGVI